MQDIPLGSVRYLDVPTKWLATISENGFLFAYRKRVTGVKKKFVDTNSRTFVVAKVGHNQCYR